MELVFDQGNDDGLVVVVVEGLKEKKIESLLEDPVVVLVLGGIFLVDNFASSHMLTIPNEHG